METQIWVNIGKSSKYAAISQEMLINLICNKFSGNKLKKTEYLMTLKQVYKKTSKNEQQTVLR